MEREATGEWLITEVAADGTVQERLLLAAEVFVDGGVLVVRERLTDTTAAFYAPGSWRTATRTYTEMGRPLPADDPGARALGYLVDRED